VYSEKFKSVAQKIISEKGARIEFISINENGADTYYYIFITEADFARMQKDIESGKYIVPENYGLVFFDGKGTERNQVVEERIKDILATAVRN
jgi:hypothetical protein